MSQATAVAETIEMKLDVVLTAVIRPEPEVGGYSAFIRIRILTTKSACRCTVIKT